MRESKFFMLCLFLTFLLFSWQSDAQEPGKQVPVKIPVTQTTPTALLYLPDDYNVTAKDYPILLFFHGSGEAGNNLDVLRSQGLPKVIDDGKPPFSVNRTTGDTTKFIVLSIQSPTSNPYLSPNAATMLAGVQTLIKDYNIRIDKTRMYPTGLSAGGRESLWGVRDYPGQFAAAVPMSIATGIAQNKVDSFKNAHLWFFIGTLDIDRRKDATYDSDNWINQKYPGQSRVTSYNNGHCCWTTFYDPLWTDSTGMSIYDFLLQYRIGGEVAPAGIQPVADAGIDRSITLPQDTVVLDGSHSTGTITQWSWGKKSGPDGVSIQQDGAKAVISNLKEGTYEFYLTVSGSVGTPSSDIVVVTVKPAPVADKPPVIVIDSSRAVVLPKDSVRLDASASFDPDGSIKSFEWTSLSAPDPGFVIVSPDSPITNVTGLKAGDYVFQLTVTNSTGVTAFANIRISVSAAPAPVVLGTINQPIADAGPDIVTTMPLNKVSLDASGTLDKNEKNGAFFYNWVKISGPDAGEIVFPTKQITDFRNLVVGTYLIELTFHINQGPRVKDTVQVTVKPDLTVNTDIPYSANTKLNPYTDVFQYGTNPGSYGNGWDDTAIASIATQAGVHSLRLPLPDYFVGSYGYDTRKAEFDYYTNRLGMKDNTLFVERPRAEYAKPGTYVFKNLYEPIWDNGENGTPINENNYFALYLYNLIVRYGKHIKFWEVVNEPDMTGFWDNGNKSRPDNWWVNPPGAGALLNLKDNIFSYIRMLRVAYEVIKKYDPDAYVAPGGIGYPAFLDALLRYTDNPDGGKVTDQYPLTGGAYFDVVSYHIYPAYNLTEWDNSIGGFRNFRFSDRATNAVFDLKDSFETVLNTRGYNGSKYPKKLFILTESNMTRKPFDGYWGGEEVQRNFIIKTLVKAQAEDIKQFYIYIIGDADNLNTAKNAYDLMGLYENLKRDRHGSEKLTSEGKAYKTTSMMLYGWGYDDARTRQLNLPDEADGVAFKKGSEYRYVLWAKTHTDNSEQASAVYSFPDSFGLDSLYQYGWDYAVNPASKAEVGAKNVNLTGTPVFLSESKLSGDVNLPPISNPGDDITIALPVDSVMVDGSKSLDPDGKIVTYKWVKTTGPDGSSIQNADASQTVISGLEEGVYTFTLTVTDDQGESSSSELKITVDKKANQAPTAVAGNDLTIQFPQDSAQLDGSGSKDDDGSIVKYLWTQVSGPGNATVTDPASAVTLVKNLLSGVYEFSLKVEDNDGGISVDKIKVTVLVSENQKPVADAGPDQQVTLPETSATLDGSKSSDPDGTIVKYQWTQVSGPRTATFGNSGSAVATVTGLVPGTYVFGLQVEDNNGGTATDQMKIIVGMPANQVPVANAGSDQQITLPVSAVTLDGSQSDDKDGSIVKYGWMQLSGPDGAAFSSPDAAVTDVKNLTQGVYVFVLTVEDNQGGKSEARVNVVVNQAGNLTPVVSPGADQIITLPLNHATLDGSASKDADGTIIQYTWTQVSGPDGAEIETPDQAITDVKNLIAGVYVFHLKIVDDGNATSEGQVKITVEEAQNLLPTADAGNDQTITLPTNSIQLDGSKSADTDGSIVKYTWTQTSGPAGADIENAGQAVTKVQNLVAGTYVFNLAVEDNNGAVSEDAVTIVVGQEKHTPPVANAGSDQIVTFPVVSITLDGSGSKRGDTSISLYQWSQVSGPGSAIIDRPDSAVTTVKNLVPGVYVFSLLVKDSNHLSDVATIRITVNAVQNKVPVADAGNDQQVTLPQSGTTLDGSASKDPDGTIAGYLWTQVSGPSSSAISDKNAATPNVSGLAEGVYVFNLVVTDNKGATAEDQVTITVNPEITTIPPVAKAGPDQVITLPDSTIVLDGSQSSASDGVLVSYYWEQLDGPKPVVIEGSTRSTAFVSGLQKGDYTFMLTVEDNNGGQGSAVVKVHVNMPPVAVIKITQQDFSQQLSEVLLDGSGSYDPDGEIRTYRWLQRSGPDGGAVIATTEGSATKISFSESGTYVFELTVTDNYNAANSVTTTISFNNETENKNPVADAGEDRYVIIPQDSAEVLDGSKSYDEDGTIISYLWEQVDGPEGIKISDIHAATTGVSGFVLGSYTFKLTVTDNNGGVSSAIVRLVGKEGSPIVKADFLIYPVPVTGNNIHIKISRAVAGKSEFRIVDARGGILRRYGFGDIPEGSVTTLDLTGLSQGAYFIQIFEKGKPIGTEKFIKMH